MILRDDESLKNVSVMFCDLCPNDDDLLNFTVMFNEPLIELIKETFPFDGKNTNDVFRHIWNVEVKAKLQAEMVRGPIEPRFDIDYLTDMIDNPEPETLTSEQIALMRSPNSLVNCFDVIGCLSYENSAYVCAIHDEEIVGGILIKDKFHHRHTVVSFCECCTNKQLEQCIDWPEELLHAVKLTLMENKPNEVFKWWRNPDKYKLKYYAKKIGICG
ncbi:unnamed protein product [Caenorhabditis bovis]|nr:unnamed protein product [Caenorhabditis bovis]